MSPAEEKAKLIKWMKKMKGLGNTFQWVADDLNKRGVPTFSGKGLWYAQTVHTILKRCEEDD
jgi:hypothetical protein